jgi:hypothetical protein
MDQRKEQRVRIRFCANLGKSTTETLTMIQQAFGDQILSSTQVFQWHARFKTCHTSVDDDEHTGRSTSCTTPETVARIQELVRQDQCRTVHDIAEGRGNWLWDKPTGSDERIGHAPCGSFTMTTPRLTLPSSPSSFWRKTKWLSTPTNRTPLILHPVTSSCFQK